MRPAWLVAALPLLTVSGCRSREIETTPATSRITPPRPPARDAGALAIGMLVPTTGPRRSLGDEAQTAAAMALEEANAAEGEPRLVLSVRPDDGQWGAQAREASALIYEDGCVALVAALDGAATHVVEQVATKAQVPVVTPWASEDTVTQAGVPWVFRCVPSDRQQAQALLSAAWAHGPPAVHFEATCDGRKADGALQRAAKQAGKTLALRAEIPESPPEQDALAKQVAQSGAGAVVVLGGSEGLAAMLPALRSQAPETEVFASLGACTPQLLATAGETLAAVRVPWPAEADSGELEDFSRRYRQRQGARPSPLAAFTYDTVSLVAEAIRQAGPSRAELQQFLTTVDRSGVTGPIRFDQAGNRLCDLTVMPAAELLGASSAE
ncbi:MAG: ABC transporter substrate-binding protein [Armatimonadota bacterium]